MPSHKMHFIIAKKFNDRINLDNDSILLGSILPDISDVDHSITHFQFNNEG